MDKSTRFIFSLLFLTSALSGAEDLNLGRGGVALDGYDPVSYFGDGPVEGSKKIESVYEGSRFRFASEENKAVFEKDPKRFLPVCGGWCAWAMLEGDKVDVNPETYKIYEGRLLLFYDGFWGDTLKRWEDKRKDTPEAELYETVLSHWKKIAEKK